MTSWVDVKDREPETYGPYIIALENGEVKEGRYIFKRGQSVFWVTGVTHWQPMPVHPTKE